MRSNVSGPPKRRRLGTVFLPQLRETWTISAKSCPERLIQRMDRKAKQEHIWGSFLPPTPVAISPLFFYPQENTQIYACTFSPAPLVDFKESQRQTGERKQRVVKTVKMAASSLKKPKELQSRGRNRHLDFFDSQPANILNVGSGSGETHRFCSIFNLRPDPAKSGAQSAHFVTEGILAESTTECCLCRRPFFRCRVAPLHDPEMILI